MTEGLRGKRVCAFSIMHDIPTCFCLLPLLHLHGLHKFCICPIIWHTNVCFQHCDIILLHGNLHGKLHGPSRTFTDCGVFEKTCFAFTFPFTALHGLRFLCFCMESYVFIMFLPSRPFTFPFTALHGLRFLCFCIYVWICSFLESFFRGLFCVWVLYFLI